MPRKRVVAKRDPMPDPKYKSVLATKFINNMMKKGKKSTARTILYDSFDIIREKTKGDPLDSISKSSWTMLNLRWR